MRWVLADSESVDISSDYIIHIGRFNRQKRHDRLIQAFAKTRTDIKLLLLGEGKVEGRIKTLVDNLGLTDRVIFLGFRKNPYPYIKMAKTLVLAE